MQVSVAAPQEVLAGPVTTQAGAAAGQAPTYVLAGAPPAGVVDPLVKQEVEPQTITIRSIDPSIQHQQNIVYSIQPIPVQQTAQPITVKTEAGEAFFSPFQHWTTSFLIANFFQVQSQPPQ